MHIHVPDGVLPVWLWSLGYLLLAFFLFISLRKVRGDEKRGIYSAAMSAAMLVAMSIPLGVPYHINLTVLAGIILGPWWALISDFVTNFVLATFGHGGITIVGLNTIVTWIESLIGLYIFKMLGRAFKQKSWRFAVSAGVSTFIALALSALLVIGIVAASRVNPSDEVHENESITIFASITLPIALIGAVVEAIVTSLIVMYMRKIGTTIIKR